MDNCYGLNYAPQPTTKFMYRSFTFYPSKFLAETLVQFSSVQSLSCVRFFVTPWTACSTPGLPVHYQLLEFTQTHAH